MLYVRNLFAPGIQGIYVILAIYGLIDSESFCRQVISPGALVKKEKNVIKLIFQNSYVISRRTNAIIHRASSSSKPGATRHNILSISVGFVEEKQRVEDF